MLHQQNLNAEISSLHKIAGSKRFQEIMLLKNKKQVLSVLDHSSDPFYYNTLKDGNGENGGFLNSLYVYKVHQIFLL